SVQPVRECVCLHQKWRQGDTGVFDLQKWSRRAFDLRRHSQVQQHTRLDARGCLVPTRKSLHVCIRPHHSCTRHSADAVRETGALMVAVASTWTSHPLRSAGAKGALWITDKWSRSVGRCVSTRTPPLSSRSFDPQTAWLETTMPLSTP